ncbi:MAG: GNAT family N-acetyltransferase [Verrucomicrobia bacterium]|jgi:ribosomal protein S18 acetylase RimI-like enzyme|nr:GNAT family N-acetyltransferase [Verrucomicrobiota bacterium]
MNEDEPIQGIRAALHSDATGLAALLNQLADEQLEDIGIVIDANPVLPEHGATILQLLDSQGSVLFVAEQGRALVGFLLVAQAEDCAGAFLAGITIAVAGGHRRRGIGTALLSAAQAHVMTSGLEGLCLTVRKHNGPAIALYKKAGCEAIGETDSGNKMRWQPRAARDGLPRPSKCYVRAQE